MPAALVGLREDRLHGSTQLYASALEALMVCAVGRPGDWARWARELAAAHPSLAAFRYLSDQLNQLRSQPRDRVQSRVGNMLRDLESYRERVRGELAPRLGPNAKVAVHSHSRVVVELLEDLDQAGRLAGVWCGRSLPGGEGAAMAEALACLSAPVVLCEDEQLRARLPEMDALLLGADAFTDKAFLNKIGTRSLCRKAGAVGAQVHVLAQSFKHVPADWGPPAGEPPLFEWTPRRGRTCHFG